MSIHILNPDVVNQISAGEVVERPSHLVKELIENSLDANSTQIHIEISSGGRYIKISDNGSGISSEDLELVLTRHATSKITKTDDLWNLSSYGFRGEALASAASVSEIKIVSRTNQSESAFELKSHFGVTSKIQKTNRAFGTDLFIEALFQNTPARLKFLKSDAAEVAQIRNVIKAMALAFHQVEFKLIVNHELDLYYAVQNLKIDRVKDVLNQKNIFIHSAQRESYIAEAYYCGPNDVAKNSKNIWLFAQDRWIQDRGLQAAVAEAYRSLLMHGEYPICAVFLKCDPTEIDVNIHPTKSQVKFQDSGLAFRAVQASIRDGLVEAPWLIQNDSDLLKSPSQINFKSKINLDTEIKPIFFQDFNSQQTFLKKKNFNFPIESLSLIKSSPAITTLEKSGYWSSLDVVGQINLTYFVCQKVDKLILIDQHAAHERVAFEKLMSYWNRKDFNTKPDHFDIQNFLFPLAIDLSNEKTEALMLIKNDLQSIGIEIDQLGPTVIGVKSSPSFIKDSVYPTVFEKMSQELIDHGGTHSLDKIIIDIFATMACHSVVRAGQSLSVKEMQHLLLEMDQFPLSSFCPHGRPVSVDFSFYEIEKKFGRIV